MACKGFFCRYAAFAYLYAFKPPQTTVLMAHSGFNKVVIRAKDGILFFCKWTPCAFITHFRGPVIHSPAHNLKNTMRST